MYGTVNALNGSYKKKYFRLNSTNLNNVHTEVVGGRGSDTQPQVSENFRQLFIYLMVPREQCNLRLTGSQCSCGSRIWTPRAPGHRTSLDVEDVCCKRHQVNQLYLRNIRWILKNHARGIIIVEESYLFFAEVVIRLYKSCYNTPLTLPLLGYAILICRYYTLSHRPRS